MECGDSSRFPKLRQVAALQRTTHCARATRAPKLSAFFIDCQNCGELMADVAERSDDVAKAERITPSLAEARLNSCSMARASEASSVISGPLAPEPAEDAEK